MNTRQVFLLCGQDEYLLGTVRDVTERRGRAWINGRAVTLASIVADFTAELAFNEADERAVTFTIEIR